MNTFQDQEYEEETGWVQFKSPFRKRDTIPDKQVTYGGGTLPTHTVIEQNQPIVRPKIF